MNYKRLNIILSLLTISLFFTCCDNKDVKFETNLSYYLEQVYNIPLSDLENKKCLFYNVFSCSSCFEINPELASELEVDFLFVVGEKSNINLEHISLVKSNAKLFFDEKKEVFNYDLIIPKPLYFTFQDSQIKYVFLEDKVYEKNILNL